MVTRLFDEERNTDGIIVQRPGVGHFLTIRPQSSAQEASNKGGK
jgi:hypothetical protein